ncbi:MULTISPECIES: DNA replication initiation control protein YabA [Lactobacillus]|uniref:DNA replication initiation control protein YabA n=1 Tax=Lactobacillus bombicola TaxID=1505723 RepID=A0A396SN39_9LACO|nr:DNA replication initiation control protein YabA [Lactobacillus bombicola]MCO6528667.1 DNA replication initiation control protein YabA [Lactobacillus sp.]RMC38775.1 DNA replication initiation control protein YabA [Lactobacillus sp. ESL0237]RMC40965.1 DNA replication initiation control protein YabA [Lactobacillus sp. ESL0233]RMC43250.1 DNA replication initiation control protein YabA [Lactobacillus sp. ESL0234]RMC44277.1 DNA replication initiation control protein YabA [Lactobacillus sp. ESL023
MDSYSKLQQLHESMVRMTKTIESLENSILDTLKENTELKVENQLLREKMDKLNAANNGSIKNQSGLESLRQIYNSGYHICNMYYGSHRDPSSDCMFCLDILDNFGEKKKSR